jgi:hypothetical protein
VGILIRADLPVVKFLCGVDLSTATNSPAMRG